MDQQQNYEKLIFKNNSLLASVLSVAIIFVEPDNILFSSLLDSS